MQQMVSGSPRLCPAHRQPCSRTCSTESKRLRKLALKDEIKLPPPKRRLADFVFPDEQNNVAEQPTPLAGWTAASRPGPSPGRASLCWEAA